MTQKIAYLDFEASALPPKSDTLGTRQFSYPVSIGIAPDYATNSTFYTRIQPTKEWIETGTWDPKSEAVHKMTLQELSRAPTVEIVSHTLSKFLQRQKITHLYVSHMADQYWAKILSQACNNDPFNSIKIQDMTKIYYDQIEKVAESGIPIELALSAFDLKPSLKRYKKITHNALEDALRQRHIFRLFLRRTNAVIENKATEENIIFRALITDPQYQITNDTNSIDWPRLSKLTGYCEKYLQTVLGKY